jgi:uncharacterized protein (DUF433 family)
MQLEDYFEFLGPNEIKLKGHRIWMEHFLYQYIHNRQSPEQIQEHFGTLSLDKVYAALLYYHQNKEAMDQYLADWLEYCHRSREEDRRRREEDERRRPEFYAERRRRYEAFRAKLRAGTRRFVFC